MARDIKRQFGPFRSDLRQPSQQRIAHFRAKTIDMDV
jgi:hypothetical protein